MGKEALVNDKVEESLDVEGTYSDLMIRLGAIEENLRVQASKQGAVEISEATIKDTGYEYPSFWMQVQFKRPEKPGERNRRLKREEKKRLALLHKAEKERLEYERLKKKFEDEGGE